MTTICFAIGMMFSAGLKMRVHELKKIVLMFDEMSVLIRFRAVRTREMIEEISKHDSLNNFIFLNILVDRLEFEDDVNYVWKTAASRTAFLSEGDKAILMGVGDRIGSTDIDGQLSMLELSKSLAEQNLKNAEADYRTKGKMLRTVWCLCGIAAGIMAI